MCTRKATTRKPFYNKSATWAHVDNKFDLPYLFYSVNHCFVLAAADTSNTCSSPQGWHVFSRTVLTISGNFKLNSLKNLLLTLF